MKTKTQRKRYWLDDGKGHRGRCDAKKTCPAMRIALADDVRARGIGTVTMMNMKTGSMTGHITYRQARDDHGGLMLNFCPWCGGSLKGNEG